MFGIDSSRQTQPAHHPDAIVVDIKLIPDQAMPGRNRVGVVIVVPAFTAAQQSDPPIVPRVIAGGEAPGSPHVGRRVDQPGSVQAQRHS